MAVGDVVAPEVEDVISCDVVVCGAGCAGTAAAIAAAESGADTVIVEANGYAGGYITAVLGATFDGMFDARTGEVVVGGIPVRFLERLMDLEVRRGDRFYNAPDLTDTGDSPDDKEPHIDRSSRGVRLDPERFKRLADRELEAAGAMVLYHAWVVEAVADSGRIEGVVVATKVGPVLIRPRVAVDCTGDADLAASAGARVLPADSLQPMSIHFRVGNVEVTEDLRERCARVLHDLAGGEDLPLYGGPWLARYGPGDIVFNAVRTPVDKLSLEGWTRAEIDGRRDAWTMLEAFKVNLPEFADAYMISTGPEAGARETRRIEGEYVLSGEDVRAERTFEDDVVKGAWWIDRHPRDRSGYHSHEEVAPYGIPYRTLVPKGWSNLLVAGRCHSSTPEANASSRVTVTAMGMGEAAGLAAAMLSKEGTVPATHLDVAELRGTLRERGCLV